MKRDIFRQTSPRDAQDWYSFQRSKIDPKPTPQPGAPMPPLPDDDLENSVIEVEENRDASDSMILRIVGKIREKLT
jgi:hypothetical protein